jgi:hypothetical protein
MCSLPMSPKFQFLPQRSPELETASSQVYMLLVTGEPGGDMVKSDRVDGLEAKGVYQRAVVRL